MLSPTNKVPNNLFKFCLDSECIDHCVHDDSLLSNAKILNPPIAMKIANGFFTGATIIGVVKGFTNIYVERVLSETENVFKYSRTV